MRWKCEFNHEWSTAYHNIQQGSWCHECSGHTPKTLEDAESSVYQTNTQSYSGNVNLAMSGKLHMDLLDMLKHGVRFVQTISLEVYATHKL